ncbi:hypothetical protein B0H16DRAFT_1480951 [Mycena metata]|uniref:Uncharacterized protein n=1 Tax=Mycena metata TaxID=1033252 RepID=A0AAD7MBF9_9AGAR|nr:hypothetical protein B0H16DRAFT_1480951 [Mycena metata]
MARQVRTRAPRAKKTTWKRINKKDRRNLKLWAEGTRESILKPHIPAYTDALERGWCAERDYLMEVCKEFHTLIPWRLEDYEEPELPLPAYNKFAKGIEEDLTEDELEMKRLKIETMNARIARWLKYRARNLARPLKMDRTRDPWAILVAKLAGINSHPKARQAFQQYMHESYESDIAPAVQARWESQALGTENALTPFRAKVARELFSELPESEQNALRQRAKDEAQKARDEYTATMKAGPSKSPEARQQCIDNLGVFMTTIMRGVSEYTGLHGFAVFGGPIPAYGGELRTVQFSCAWGRNHGTPATNFPQWSRPRFGRDVLDFVREYLRTAFKCAEAALPTDDDSLAGAKYTIGDELGFGGDDSEGPESEDSSGESDSGSDSDSEGSASSVYSDMEDSAAPRKKGKAGKKEKVKKRKEKRKEKKKERQERMETEAASRMQGRKRKREEGDAGGKKKQRPSTPSPSRSASPVADGGLTYDQQRSVNNDKNKQLLAEVDRLWVEKNPEAAKIQAEERAQRAVAAPKPKPRPCKPQGATADDQVVRRSGRLNSGSEGAEESAGAQDVQMFDVEDGEREGTASSSHAPSPPINSVNGQTPSPIIDSDPIPPMYSHPPPPLPANSLPLPPPPPQTFPPLPPVSHPPSSQDAVADSGDSNKGLVSEGESSNQTPAPATETTPATSPEGGMPPESRIDGIPPCPPGAAGWFSAVYHQISVENLGTSFNRLLVAFAQLERAYRWRQVPGQLAVAGRPAPIGKWIGAGRGGRGLGGAMGNGCGPDIGEVSVFGDACLPTWRLRDPQNPSRFLRDEYPKGSKNNWVTLRQPGHNGVLNLVAGLYWWGKRLPDEGRIEDRELWEAAVADLNWMIEGLRGVEIGEGMEIESDELRSE